ncbi:Beta-glucosidase B like protein [Verticillium longisporum]|uniref:beta-glucosidase n=1 Tax=Verticillium longisporum TaxID=100787 RepID=A0A0G4L061_VERLO|nr:Beta-glucosidase B like protein [Verticillium longisporum]KAG7140391.1 Beta-glucosidase B like protein [Verticillium longisporum]CRK15433.1 hypothetical protein BN1723_010662 [Verticillium longisporum]CRK18178.1 hypothetical protein BN1708_012266 [Verticillium longisporum]
MAVDSASIVAKLTLKEKISLLGGVDWWRTATIDRDGVFVPHIKFTDGPYGARGESYVSGIKAACFPCGTCLGATFDTAVLEKVGAAVAKEVHTKSAHVLLGPTLNVIRSPLGGRNYETYSEDPLLLGHLAAAYVRGCQADGTVGATPKHFVANDAENQRTKLSVEVDEQTLREIYLKPFQLVQKLSEPWAFMTSYNRVQGTYVADSSRLVNDVLRGEWGFNGLVISDWMGTYSVGPGIEAGVDIELPGPARWRTYEFVSKIVRDGSLSEDIIDKSAIRVLDLARRLGRFENPEEPPERAVEDVDRDRFIKEAGADGITLLKNQDDVLPIKEGSTVALIGQHSWSVVLGGGGSARVDALHAITPVQGFRNLGFTTLEARGVPVFGAVPHADPSIVFPHDRQTASSRPVRLEWFNGPIVGKNLAHEETIPQAEYMIKEKWPEYLDEDFSTRITFDLVAPSAGNHIFSVISTGRAKLYIDGELVFDRRQETKLRPESFYFFKRHLEKRVNQRLEKGRRYAITLESWACDPAILNAAPIFGKMFQGSAVRFHEEIDLAARQAEAAEAAAAADYAVVCVGTTNEIESEGFDRDTLALTTAQYDLVEAVARANPRRTVVVNFSGAPTTLGRIVDDAAVAAVVQAWFPGQETGDALAAVLAGLVNPSGRLPLSWPRRVEDGSSFGNFPAVEDGLLRYDEGLDVGYRWHDRPGNPAALFPFGFGLSYTTFRVTGSSILGSGALKSADDSIRVSAEIVNAGSRRGKVVVQFYLAFPEGAAVPGRQRPVKELQAFSKVEIEAGHTAQTTVQLDKYAVSVYDEAKGRWVAPEGEYRVLVGLSSVDIQQTASFSVSESFTWTGV